MTYTWIEQAMSVGGVLTVQMGSPQAYYAEMRWPNVEGKVRSLGNSVEQALSRLDEALRDDCADEMVRQGKV